MKLSFLWIVAFLSPGSTAIKASKDEVVEVEKFLEENLPDLKEDTHRRLDVTYLNECNLATGIHQCCVGNTCNEPEDLEVDTGSCGGTGNPCYRAGSLNGSAKIGKYSCIDNNACSNVGRNEGTAVIMENSCNPGFSSGGGADQCVYAGSDGGYAYIGSNSCISSSTSHSCSSVGKDGNATILGNSCLGSSVCAYAGNMGNIFIDEGSCGVGTEGPGHDCYLAAYEGYEMTTVRIGKNSCRGEKACAHAARRGGNLVIEDNSCLGDHICWSIAIEGGNVLIHEGACVDEGVPANIRSCWEVGKWSLPGSSVTVMGGSCIGSNTCRELGASLSQSDKVLTSAEVGVNACRGLSACQNAGRGVAIIGDGSCVTNDAESNQFEVCRYVGGIGSYFEVGRGSCLNGQNACRVNPNSPQHHIVIGDSSCFGHNSCSFRSDPENVEIGSNSCQCQDCCRCLDEGAVVPDNKCNSLGSGTESCCENYQSTTINPSFVTSGPITSPTPPTRSLTTDPPTTVFQGQNFTIGKPQSSFVDTNGNFSIMFEYSLGQSIDNLSVTLSYQNCSTLYDETDPVVWLSTQFVFAEPVVFIDTKQFASSSLVLEKSLNASIGVLAFCMRVDGLSADGTSISFRQDEINLSFDLSSNAFEVTDNRIEADAVLTSESNVTTSYSVSAYRCSQDGFEDIGTDTQLTQNEVVQICLQPVNDGVFISAFSMGFYQDTEEVKFEAVRIDGWVNPLSQLSSNDKIKKVASRVISKFFDGDANPFSVEGNAYLSFDTSRTRLLRSIQESNEAGETPFKMDVELEKGTVPTNTKESNIMGHAAMSVVGGLLILSISFVVLKKFK